MDDLLIQYHGFSPSEFARNHVHQQMQKIHDEAPASSTLRTTIHKVSEHSFKGFVRISSHAGHFFVQATSASLIDLTHILSERMRRKLDRWKGKRFHSNRHKPTLVIPIKRRDSGSARTNEGAV